MDSTSTNLLARLKHPGDHAAWNRFVTFYTPLLFFWARRARLTQEDAADLVQEVFALLVQKLPNFDYRPEQSFRGWLRVVTLNKWRERERQRRSAEILTQSGAEALDELTIPDDCQQFWEAEYRQHLVRRALQVMQAEFHPNTWKACWEMVVEGRPAAEVAQQLGISEGAVYVAKSRVLKRLRVELAGLLE